MRRMTNLEQALKTFLTRARNGTPCPRRKEARYKEGCVTVWLKDDFDRSVPMKVDAAGVITVPPVCTYGTLVFDEGGDEDEQVLGLRYRTTGSRISHLRLERVRFKPEAWWLTVITALNVEAGR